MCLLLDENWVFISQKTFFIVTAAKTSNITKVYRITTTLTCSVRIHRTEQNGWKSQVLNLSGAPFVVTVAVS
jgi:hypothetical protein